MNSFRKCTIALAASALAIVPTLAVAQSVPLPPVEASGVDAGAVQQLHDDMQALVSEKQRAGIAWVVMIDGKIVSRDGVGYANLATKAPMAPDSIVRLFSMSRALSTAAFLTLVDEGKVSLDDPVAKYLPEFADTRVMKSYDNSVPGTNPQVRPMTVRMVLDYTAGLGYAQTYPKSMHMVQSEIMGPGITTTQAIRNIAKLPLQSQPGEHWRYSFSGDVAGRIAEVVSGKPLDQFLRDALYVKLGMKDTGFWAPKKDLARLSIPYGPLANDPLADLRVAWTAEFGTFDKPIESLSAGGGLVSTADDYIRLLAMLSNGGVYNGRQVLKPATVADMLSQHAKLEEGLAYRPQMSFGYGLGVLDDMAPRPFGVEGHEATWGGLANTVFYIDPVNHMAAVGMTQYYGADGARFPEAFRKAVYRLIATKPAR